MKYKKVYGDYKTDSCIFCGNNSHKKNAQGFPVCKSHEGEEDMPAYRCICGDYVDILVGKYGVYCKCYRCGNINFDKIREHNDIIQSKDINVQKKKIESPDKRTDNSDDIAMRYRIFLD